jgi:light-regulated signal transduction histidine kinase (bacteriophytochrome)
MPGAMLTSAVDLDACDREPIHIIGAIQPNGALIAADVARARIEFASANVDAYLGRSADQLLGLPLVALLGESQCAGLFARSLEPTQPDLLRPHFLSLAWPDGREAALECFCHVHDGRLILEFVHRQEGPAAVWEEDLVRQRIISDLIQPDTLTGLARIGAEIIRDVTGFDRVMIYRFAPDRHGEVIAESTVRADTFLGLHYPASDIPEPARRHFVLNVIRSIPDITAPPVPIRALAAGAGQGRPLDLTFSKLRAVAPVHIEYLGNMGVGASCSISLIANGQLWGLVACHHYGPLHLSWSRLRFCELLGGTMSALLQSLENRIQLAHGIRAEKTAFAIERQARQGRPLRAVVTDEADALMEQGAAEGMMLRLGGQVVARGRVPERQIVPAALSAALFDGIATSNHLAGLSPHDASGSNGIAGAAMMELSDDGEDWLILFRQEFEHTITWAGKPGKRETVGSDGTLRLSPRGSFALWREERRGRSQPFTAIDAEFLRIVRRALFAMNSLDRERAAVAARSAAEAEEARLRLALMDAVRSRSMGELASALAHELNQPLFAVTNYVNACRQELKNHGVAVPGDVHALMDGAVAESSRAADLVRRLRNLIGQGEISVEPSDLNAVIRRGTDLALAASRRDPPTVVYQLLPDLPLLSVDPVQVAQVVLNLVRNSLAAMEDRANPVLTLSTRRFGRFVEVAVRDTGAGIDAALQDRLFEPFHPSTTSGMGIGLSLCRSIVEAHGGRIRVRPVTDGTEVSFTLKIADGETDG